MSTLQDATCPQRKYAATVRVLNCRCPLDATCPQQKCDATVRVFNCRRPLVDQNINLSVEETLLDPRYVQLKNEEDQRRHVHHEIHGTPCVLSFPDALPTCLNRCIIATCDVIRCCLRNRSDHNVQLSVEETQPRSDRSSVQPWFLNEGDGEMSLRHIQQPS